MSGTLVVTGVDGFVGRHLARMAAAEGLSVIGVARSTEVRKSLADSLAEYHSADLRVQWPSSIPAEAPVVHLAGLAAVGASFDRPQDYITGNTAMVTTMCEARVAAGATGRVVGVSTGAVYAHRHGDGPRTEEHPVAFTSPYVVSKVSTEHQFEYYRRRGLDTVVVRPFNHIGPGQTSGFIVPDLIERLRVLATGERLRVGNLATRRDYTDVRDVARAYLGLATSPGLEHEVYNVSSGVSTSGRDLLAYVCRALGRAVPPTETDPSRVRVTDPEEIVGNSTRLREEIGWEPRVDIAQSVAEAASAAPKTMQGQRA
jgi:GDP-4-dehydro-6-deoxy-D-mannose reductase